MTPAPLSVLVQRASDWLVEPAERQEPPPRVESRRHPLVAVVGLAHRCGATTVARALGLELARRAGGAAVVAAPEPPAVVALGSSGCASRLADALPELEHRRPSGRLCLARCVDAVALEAVARSAAPAVLEVEPGSAAIDTAPVADRVVLVASPGLVPPLAAAVAETIEDVALPPVVAVNRAPDHGPWLVAADVLIPDSRVGARLALAGRAPHGWLGRSIEQLADLCLAG